MDTENIVKAYTDMEQYLRTTMSYKTALIETCISGIKDSVSTRGKARYVRRKGVVNITKPHTLFTTTHKLEPLDILKIQAEIHRLDIIIDVLLPFFPDVIHEWADSAYQRSLNLTKNEDRAASEG